MSSDLIQRDSVVQLVENFDLSSLCFCDLVTMFFENMPD